MRKLLVLLLSVCLVVLAVVLIGPGGYHDAPEPGRGAHFLFLPGVAQIVLIVGLAYYVLNGIYYQKPND
ncbi:MAG: hypothetical protein GPOALKHO_000385 [Sodalis sp.]|uniref:hypothetical protein n=1 Tax=Sodalis sp. (in: enterobacteria) TaxID=1898979 RepID=UPI0038736A35|nr:MAG: hypothetical protein GPOALKHO_000385 [Sodalis sp.]